MQPRSRPCVPHASPISSNWIRKNTFIVSSSSYIRHGVGPLVDPFRSYVSRSLFKVLP
jgi:hypothetical protein